MMLSNQSRVAEPAVRSSQTITLELSSLDELLTTRSPNTFPAKGIDGDADRFLYGQTDRMKWAELPHIRVVLPADEIQPDTRELIATVAQKYFSYRASEAQFELAVTFGRGLRSLIIAGVFVGILLVIDYLVDQVHNDYLDTA
jgi:hypothetical protein